MASQFSGLGSSTIKQILIDLEIRNRGEAKKVIADLNKELDKAKLKTGEWDKKDKLVLDRLNKVKASLKQSNNEIDQMSKKTRTFGQHLGSAFKRAFSLEKILNRMAFVITAKLSYELFQIAENAMKSIITNTIKWEEEMSKVYSLLDRTEDKYRGLMDENVLRLMIKYGQTLEESVRAVYDTLSARFDPQDVGIITEASATLAIAEFTNIRTATDLLTTTLNSFNLEASESDRIINLLSQTITDAKSTIAEMGPNFGKIAASASALNLSLEDTVALFSLLTIKGIKTDVAITAIRQLMFTLAAPTEKAKKAMNEYGVSLDLNRIKAEGFKVILEELKGADEDFLFTLVKTRRGAMALLPMLDSGAMFMEILKNQTDGTTAAFDKFDERSEITKIAVDKLKNSFFLLGQSIGEDFNPFVRAGAEVLTAFNIQAAKFKDTGFATELGKLLTIVAGLIAAAGVGGLFKWLFSTAPLVAAGKSISGLFSGITKLGNLIIKSGGLIAYFWSKATDLADTTNQAMTDYMNQVRAKMALDETNSAFEIWAREQVLQYEKDIAESKFEIISKAKEELELAKGIKDIEFIRLQVAKELAKLKLEDPTSIIKKQIGVLRILQEESRKYLKTIKETGVEGSQSVSDVTIEIERLEIEIIKLQNELKKLEPLNLKEVFDIDAGTKYLDALGSITNQIYKMITAGDGIGSISDFIRTAGEEAELSGDDIDKLYKLLLKLLGITDKVDVSGWQDYASGIVSIIDNMVSSIDEIYSAASENRQLELDRDLRRMQEREDAEIESAERIGLNTENIRDKYDKMRDDANEKAREKDIEFKKKMQPLQVAVATGDAFVAFNSALKTDLPPIVREIYAGSVLALGLSKAAAIAAIKYAKGGRIEGDSHSQGGVPFSVGGRVGFEAEGGEYIVNKQATSLYLPLLEAINGMQQVRMPAVVQKNFAVGGGIGSGGDSSELAGAINNLSDRIDTMEFSLTVSNRQAGKLTNAGNKHLEKTRPG